MNRDHRLSVDSVNEFYNVFDVNVAASVCFYEMAIIRSEMFLNGLPVGLIKIAVPIRVKQC